MLKFRKTHAPPFLSFKKTHTQKQQQTYSLFYQCGLATRGTTRWVNSPKAAVNSLSADQIKLFQGKHAAVSTESDTQTCFFFMPEA